MAQATIAAMPNTVGAARARRAARVAGLVAELRKILNASLDPYRPELHYMRGPGPKWREKHGNATPAR